MEWGMEWAGERGFCLPLLEKKKYHFWNSLFGQVLTPHLVELSRGVERVGEPLMLSITYTILLGSESPTLNVYSCLILLAQCRAIIDTTNAIDRSVGSREVHGGCMSVSLGGTDFVEHPPSRMPIP